MEWREKWIGGKMILLTLIFTILKLNHVIDWEWIWVLSPLWIVVLPIVGLIVFDLVLSIISTVIEAYREAKEEMGQKTKQGKVKKVKKGKEVKKGKRNGKRKSTGRTD